MGLNVLKMFSNQGLLERSLHTKLEGFLHTMTDRPG
jgi:hypothetical protein